MPLESPSHSDEKDRPITPLTPLTPGTSKKAYMEPLLAPPTLSQDPQYSKEKASELFVKGHSDIGVTVSKAGVPKGNQRVLNKKPKGDSCWGSKSTFICTLSTLGHTPGAQGCQVYMLGFKVYNH